MKWVFQITRAYAGVEIDAQRNARWIFGFPYRIGIVEICSYKEFVHS
jgi:hypothetical protein